MCCFFCTCQRVFSFFFLEIKTFHTPRNFLGVSPLKEKKKYKFTSQGGLLALKHLFEGV